VAFIGCFGLAALSVSVHVALTHAGRGRRLEQRPWQVAGFALLLASALAFRFAVDLDPTHFMLWLGAASGSFLAATVLWGWLVVPHLTGRPPEARRERLTSRGPSQAGLSGAAV
jgi:uncharacterized protein involved in response to NO